MPRGRRRIYEKAFSSADDDGSVGQGLYSQRDSRKMTGYKVGYVCNNFNDTFQTYVMDAAEAYFNGVADVDIVLQDSVEDVIRQQDLVNTLIAQKV